MKLSWPRSAVRLPSLYSSQSGPYLCSCIDWFLLFSSKQTFERPTERGDSIAQPITSIISRIVFLKNRFFWFDKTRPDPRNVFLTFFYLTLRPVVRSVRSAEDPPSPNHMFACLQSIQLCFSNVHRFVIGRALTCLLIELTPDCLTGLRDRMCVRWWSMYT